MVVRYFAGPSGVARSLWLERFDHVKEKALTRGSLGKDIVLFSLDQGWLSPTVFEDENREVQKTPHAKLETHHLR